MKCEYSLKHYQELLWLLRGQGYKFCYFTEKPDPKKKMIWLRHDIDASLEGALQMAYIEYETSYIPATYFIRLRSPWYNIFTKKSQDIINNIIDLQHHIGFHFQGYPRDYRFPGDIRQEFKILEKYFFIEKIIAQHCPSSEERNRKIKSFISAYEPRFYSEIQYISDSSRRWHCPCKRLQNLSNNIQILTHPVWWTEK